MKRIRIILLVNALLIILFLTNISFGFAGYKTDPVGDTTVQGVDITRVDISKKELKITLAEAPVLNEGETTIFTYNLWIDTSNEDPNPDTTTWSSEVYEYIAHFKYYYTGGQWRNESYLKANRYYLTSDGGEKQEGSFWWNANTKSWQNSDPAIDFAEVIGSTITFDTEGALYREQPLGTGYVIQGVANAGADLVIEDIGPNSGWVDEFDGEYIPPTTNDSDDTTAVLLHYGLLGTILVLGAITIIATKSRE